MQHQEQTNWCWAATAASVSAFFNPSTTWTQCKIVNAELGRTGCCTNGSSSYCNISWYLDRALTRTGNFVSMSWGTGTMSDVKNEIDNNRPLGVRIGWSGGGGHFVALDGYSQTFNMVAVDDPWYGASDVDLAVFQTSYQGSGSWTHSYRVKP
jgi:Papain-like cysteine protease AvrRpt2